MAIKIHHGPNGSYKTSGAVWDDAVPAARAGRLIITNIRGMSRERFEHLFDDLPSSFDLMHIDHESEQGMEKIRTWFQWAPRDAFMIFDEAQTLFPQKWNAKYLERFDFPGGPDAAKLKDLPMNWLDAWTRHRHFNWDIVLTTPNIKYVHDDIRGTSEAAYQHSNLALLGKWMKKIVGKDYKEAMHSAQENKAPTDGSNIVTLRKIDKRVFQLYDSTATGLHRDTMAGKNILGSPRILALVGMVFAIFGYVYWSNGSAAFSNPLAVKPASTSPQVHQGSIPQNPSQSADMASHGVSAQQAHASDGPSLDPFDGYVITVEGSLWNEKKGISFMFKMTKDGHQFSQTSKDLTLAGYSIFARGTCAAELVYKGVHRTVACIGELVASAGGEKRLGAERRADEAGQSSKSSGPLEPVVVSDSAREVPLAVASYNSTK